MAGTRTLMMRRWHRAAMLTLPVALTVGVWGSAASADTTRVSSQPNGDLAVTVSVGALTDKDRDGDFNTATHGDIASLFFAVANNSDVTQTIQIAYLLDGPGTALDRAVTTAVVLEPGGIHQEVEDFRIQRSETPLGEYRLTVTASGTETATTTGTFTVQAKS
jgi:hypothetical protein